MILKVGAKILAMITGGGRGLGYATAKHFIQQGARVAILDLPESNEQQQITSSLDPDRVVFCPCDVTDSGDVMEAIDTMKSKFGQPNVLVNCAGVATTLSIYHQAKKSPHRMSSFERLIDTNITGTFNVIRLLVPEIVMNEPDEEGQRGVIINTSSIAAHEGEYGQFAYATSMAAVNSMTLPLARELSFHGIRVCTISPGYFNTPMISSLPEKILNYLIMQVPHPKRLGLPEEYAMTTQAIVDNPYLNGEIIRLDGALRPAH